MPSSIKDKSKGRLLTLHDLQDYRPPPVRHLIHSGVLNVGSRMVVFGDEGTFKSATTVHAGFALARGSQWLGFNTSPCNILYIQGEMSLSETKERLDQYIQGSRDIFAVRPVSVPPGTEPQRADKFAQPDNFVIETVTQDVALDTPNGYNFIKNEIELMITEMPSLPIVLIYDPLFKMFRYDLIKEDDMRALTENIDRLSHDRVLFANHPGMASMIVHHSRKAQVDETGNRISSPGSTEMFGSGHLKWWADTIVKCDLDPRDRTDSTVNIKFTKHRLMRYPPPEKIIMYWDRDTYHPHIVSRIYPEKPEGSRDFKGLELGLLE